MGRTNGLTGGVTGKVGNWVFYYRNGKYVAREYISKINNPKSERQVKQRLKMALAGRLSSIVPFAALEGMGGTKSDRRSAFMSNLLMNISSDGSKASVNGSDVIFSVGEMSSLKRHQVTGSSSVSIRTVTYTLSDDLGYPEVPAGYGERYVVLLLNNETSQFDYCQTGLLNIPAAGETATTDVNVRVGAQTVPYTYFAYTYPFLTGVSDGRMRTSYIGTEDGTLVVDVLTGETLGTPVVFGRSSLLVTGVINPPTA